MAPKYMTELFGDFHLAVSAPELRKRTALRNAYVENYIWTTSK